MLTSPTRIFISSFFLSFSDSTGVPRGHVNIAYDDSYHHSSCRFQIPREVPLDILTLPTRILVSSFFLSFSDSTRGPLDMSTSPTRILISPFFLSFSDSTRGPPGHVNIAYEDSNLVIPEGKGGGKQLKASIYTDPPVFQPQKG